MAQTVKINLRAYDHQVLDLTAARIVEICKTEGCEVAGPIPLPTEKTIYTILRATHKYKDSREQFEKRVHKRLIQLVNPSAKVLDTLSRQELPAGVEIQIKL